MTRILAVASGGGHWRELLRLQPAFSTGPVSYATVESAYRSEVGDAPFYLLPDATRWSPTKMGALAARVLWLVRTQRPEVVISTGAAPGYWALRFAKARGARTIWVDSVANAESLSMSGRMVRPYADLWLTQWPHLAWCEGEGPEFAGRVL